MTATDQLPEDQVQAERLRDLLFGHERETLDDISDQLQDPERLSALISPVLVEVIKERVAESGELVSDALAPVMDRAIALRIEQNRDGIAAALSGVISDVIALEIERAGPEVTRVLAPVMGSAIKEQIRSSRDEVVDALYPVIGTTITKYMAETIRTLVESVNEKVQNHMSADGIKRKIRARLTGVSEAELMLQEAVGYQVQAVFVIHRASGLVIAHAQRGEELAADVIAGMLTAIRDFAGDWLSAEGEEAEIDQIDYGANRIVLEVAGSCYAALVVRGQADAALLQRVRDLLGDMVLDFGERIDEFADDPSRLPESVEQAVAALALAESSAPPPSRLQRAGSWLVAAGLLALLLYPVGRWWLRARADAALSRRIVSAMADDPALSVYRIDARVAHGAVTLEGRVQSHWLRERALRLAEQHAASDRIDNRVIAVQVPPDPRAMQESIARVSGALNAIPGVRVRARLDGRRLLVDAHLARPELARTVEQTLTGIPGVEHLTLRAHQLEDGDDGR